MAMIHDYGAADGHDRSDDALDPPGALALVGLEVAAGILGDGDIGRHPAGHGLVVGNFLGDDQRLQLTGLAPPPSGTQYTTALPLDYA